MEHITAGVQKGNFLFRDGDGVENGPRIEVPGELCGREHMTARAREYSS
jgi:hypothetical protein